jgi:hypothetical protein
VRCSEGEWKLMAFFLFFIEILQAFFLVIDIIGFEIRLPFREDFANGQFFFVFVFSHGVCLELGVERKRRWIVGEKVIDSP